MSGFIIGILFTNCIDFLIFLFLILYIPTAAILPKNMDTVAATIAISMVLIIADDMVDACWASPENSEVYKSSEKPFHSPIDLGLVNEKIMIMTIGAYNMVKSMYRYVLARYFFIISVLLHLVPHLRYYSVFWL